jgi:LAO/AO transport system kinase
MSGGGGNADADAGAVVAGNRRAVGKLITRIECADPSVLPVLDLLYPRGTHSPVLGITGPPGAGKSALVDQLIERLRARDERLAVLAVDPSSPFTGGAILGDRIRMARHNTDPKVFIRSMAARGHLGGLAGAVGDALIVFDAMGVDRILVETVGVGQNEMDIMQHADTVVVVQTPSGGDVVQAVKAGLLEAGDIYVMNKMDTGGVDRAVAALCDSVDFRHPVNRGEAWRPPVVKTQALEGAGVDEVVDAVLAHRRHFERHPRQLEARRRLQMSAGLVERVAALWRFRNGTQHQSGPAFEYWLNEVMARRSAPSAAAAALLAGFIREGVTACAPAPLTSGK